MRIIYVIGLVLLSKFIMSQDIHYSQFDKTKAITNPSLIANQKSDYEVLLQRRSQWSRVSVPFSTFAFSFNAKEVYKTLSLGGTILNDVAGDSRFLTNGGIISLVKSYMANTNHLALGLQAGLYQRSINFDNLIFLENENLRNKSFSFFDFGIGASNQKKINNNSYLLIGGSIHHLNKPKQTLLANTDVYLHQKYILHLAYSNRFSYKTDVLPVLYFSSQNKDQELIIGSRINYQLNDLFSLNTGFYSRIKDALIFTLGIQNSNFEAIISYDLNTSTLVNASNSVGAIEFSIAYSWNIENEVDEGKEINEKICPRYL